MTTVAIKAGFSTQSKGETVYVNDIKCFQVISYESTWLNYTCPGNGIIGNIIKVKGEMADVGEAVKLCGIKVYGYKV